MVTRLANDVLHNPERLPLNLTLQKRNVYGPLAL